MARIKVDQSKATPEIAEASVKLCPFGAIYYKDGVLGINEACRMCKLCVRKGAPGVFTLEEEAAAPAIDKNQWRGVTVFIEHGVEGIHPVSFELIGKARELAAVIDHPVYAVLFSDDVNKHVDEILSYGVDKVYCYEHPAFGHFNVEIYANAMEHFINNVKPTVILYGGTSLGRSFAPRVAARFRTGLTVDCTILGMKPNTDPIQNRPASAGTSWRESSVPTIAAMATVRQDLQKTGKTTPHGES